MNRTLLMAVCAWSAALAAGDELSLTPRQGVVLLANGELIAGEIVAAGDRYDVHLPSGEISIKRSEVALVCRDAEECYLHRRTGIDGDSAAAHLNLAEWCVKNGLLNEAEGELAAARAIDAKHPKIEVVESRLALAKEPRRRAAESAAEPDAAPPPPDAVPSVLPPGTMETFTNTIQPLVLNYCSKSGCHSARGAAALKLERLHPKLSGRLTTQRNLERVLKFVDRQDPSQSRLLTAPVRPHGNAKAPIFSDREQSQYKQLVMWVFAVAGAEKAREAPTLAERTAPLLQAMPGSGGVAPAAAREPALPPAAGTGAAAATTPGDAPAPALRDGSQIPPSSAEGAFTRDELRAMGLLHEATSKVQHGADAKPAFVPKDPFDPEIFNRRFHGRDR
jgi:hypothetical protein